MNIDPYVAQFNADVEIATLKKLLSVVEQNARDWENRYRTLKRTAPSANAMVIEMNPGPYETLMREATIRRIRPEAFAKLLLEQITTDKLFAAILDR